MLFLKKNYFLRSKILLGYIDNYHYMQQSKQFLDALKAYCSINYTNNKGAFKTKDSSNVQGKLSISHFSTCNRKQLCCTNTVPKDPNVFGDLSYEKYERVSMDEAEEKEEKFSERVMVPRKYRFTYIDYIKLIKSHLFHKNLKLALSVLDLMKQYGDKPNGYIYRLLLSAFAKQGDIKQCFKLFKAMRDRGIVPAPSVYNTLINACSETNDKKKALDSLSYLREYFHHRNIQLNKVHYMTFIKAYSRHNQSLIAFKLADEAMDKGCQLSDIFAVLFHTAVGDKENGLKLALILWHKMRISKIKPNRYHYDLLLRVIRDSEFGNLKVNDTLIPGVAATQIQFTETKRPDLLDSPPVLSTSLIPLLKEHSHSNNHFTNSSSELDVVNKQKLLSVNLNDVLKENRLVLFGGIDKLLKRMQDDGVIINKKTVTLILELLPPTIKAEEYYLKYIEQHQLEIDMTFYNMLIKRRCTRHQYEYAKNVLNEIQRHHLTPNVITFGVLAIGCIKFRDGRELLEQMDTIGYAPNYIVLQTLIYNACCLKNFSYLLYLMNYMLKNRIEPTEYIFETIERFDDIVLHFLENEGNHDYEKVNRIRKRYHEFKIKYENWKEKVQKNVTMPN